MTQKDWARAASEHGETLGLDEITVCAVESELFGVRLANSAICRENVFREARTFDVSGSWQGRSGSVQVAASTRDELLSRVAALRESLATQPADKEFVPAEVPRGTYSFDLAKVPFSEAYAPDVVYPRLADLAARARAKGLRLTGYVEAQETRAHRFVAGTTRPRADIATRDHGLAISLTVDDPKTGAVSGGNRGVALATPERIAAALEAAYFEAESTCLAGRDPVDPTPGDVTVVLHPQAVADIVNTSFIYGFFDRRKIDEGRTYLAGRVGQERFPAALRLAQATSLPLPGGGTFADMPFNHRLVPCESVELIGNGALHDLHTSAFWARKSGKPETFDTHGGAPATLIDVRAGAGIELAPDLAALIAKTERGYYVHNTWYLRMVAEMDGVITGMTRDGVFEIKDGKLSRPVRNMRWHENPIRVLSAISGATKEQLTFGRSRLAGQGRSRLTVAPAVRVEGFHFSSVTKF